MQRLISILAVPIISYLFTVCFSSAVLAESGVADHFKTQIDSAFSHLAEMAVRNRPMPETGGNILAPPANDHFINRINLTGSTGSSVVNNTSATFENGEPFHFFYGFGQNTIWYKWTAPSSGTFGFDTLHSAAPAFIKIYQGSILTNLTPIEVRWFPYYSYVQAHAGDTFQIAVMGADQGIAGNTTLRYYPDTVSGSTNLFMVTSRYPLIIPASDGSIAYTISTATVAISSPTNSTGQLVNPSIEYQMNPEGLNIYDRKNTGLVINAQPNEAGTQYLMLDYDGKQVLLYNQLAQKVLLYRVSKQGLTKMGETIVSNVFEGEIQGSYVYIRQGIAEFIEVFQFPTGIMAFDKRLRKLKWQLPYKIGHIYLQPKTGYAFRHNNGAYSQELIRYKKGVEQNRSYIDYSFSGHTQVKTDPIGNILHWYRHGPQPFRTNSPLTYISRKGEELFSNKTLPDAGNAWAFGGFEKTRMYIVRPNGPEQIASGFKFGKTITQSGNLPISSFNRAQLHDKQLTVFRKIAATTEGFIQYDKNIKKETWNESPSQGDVEYISKGVFGRMQVVTSSGTTNFILRIFNKKKKIADHQITL